MKTVKQYTWEVVALSTPLIKKKCSKCNSTTLFYSSDKFRLNSQKKYIDVWLIYKCQHCDTTYNLTIFSRTKPDMIDKALLRKLMDNDEHLAWQYAFDYDTVKRNNVELDYSCMEYKIIKEDLSLYRMVELGYESVEFVIKANYNLPFKLSQIIRMGLEISSSRLDKMLSMGIISVLPIGTIPKKKVKDGTKVILDSGKLKTFLQESLV